MESILYSTLTERPWRVPEGERRPSGEELRTALDRINALFEEFADPHTTSCAARGLVQGVMLTVGNDGRNDNEGGRALREMIVAFLTDVGTQNPHLRCENDPEVREAARRTLAQHVCPIIACSDHRSYDSYTNEAGKQTAGLYEENLGTLKYLVRFYEESEHVSKLDGKHLQNVKECLGRVYRELRRHLNAGPFEKDATKIKVRDVAHVLLQRLNHLFVERRWWDVLSVVRAVSAIPALYEAASRIAPRYCPEAQKAIKAPLQFDWGHLESFRCDGSLARRLNERHEAIEQDLWAIQALAGGMFDPKEHHELTLVPSSFGRCTNDLWEIRPLLLDLVSTFVREAWFAHIRASG